MVLTFLFDTNTNIFLLNQKEKNNVTISMVMQVVQSFSIYVITMKQTMAMFLFYQRALPI